MKLKPRNWAQFQHYKDRAPPWIKLHKALLDDRVFQRLPDASRALAPCLWLLASEADGGVFDGSVEEIAFRVRQPEKWVSAALKPLIDNGFFSVVHVASAALAKRQQDACLETEAEREEETEKEGEGEGEADSGSALRTAPPTPPPDFDGLNAEVLNGKSVVPIAAGFTLPEPWGLDAEALGFKPGEVMREGEKFRQYWTAGKGKGTRRSVKGWRQSWSNWLEKAAKDQR